MEISAPRYDHMVAVGIETITYNIRMALNDTMAV